MHHRNISFKLIVVCVVLFFSLRLSFFVRCAQDISFGCFGIMLYFVCVSFTSMRLSYCRSGPLHMALFGRWKWFGIGWLQCAYQNARWNPNRKPHIFMFCLIFVLSSCSSFVSLNFCSFFPFLSLSFLFGLFMIIFGWSSHICSALLQRKKNDDIGNWRRKYTGSTGADDRREDQPNMK